MRKYTFVSYSKEDQEIAKEICLFLRKEDIPYWDVYRSLEKNNNYFKSFTSIIKALQNCEVLLILVSKSNRSPELSLEAKFAQMKRMPIILFSIDDDIVDIDLHSGFYLRNSSLEENLKILKSYLDSLILSKKIETRTDGKKEQTRFEKKISSTEIEPAYFTVTGPQGMIKGKSYVIKVWAHLEKQKEEVIKIAKVTHDEAEIDFNGPVPISGSTIEIKLIIPDFEVNDPQDILLWEGKITKASFPVIIPEKAAIGNHNAELRFYAGGLQISKLHFELIVAKKEKSPAPLEINGKKIHKAFVSYSSKDKNEVLARIQAIEKIVPDLDIFLDKKNIRSGEYWKKRLKEEIKECDIFYLFWSENAAKSTWVEREWRCALKNHGIDVIDPFPLVPPEIAPPPEELEAKHFYDAILAHMN